MKGAAAAGMQTKGSTTAKKRREWARRRKSGKTGASLSESNWQAIVDP